MGGFDSTLVMGGMVGCEIQHFTKGQLAQQGVRENQRIEFFFCEPVGAATQAIYRPAQPAIHTGQISRDARHKRTRGGSACGELGVIS